MLLVHVNEYRVVRVVRAEEIPLQNGSVDAVRRAEHLGRVQSRGTVHQATNMRKSNRVVDKLGPMLPKVFAWTEIYYRFAP